MRKYWLMKSEPDVFSFSDLVAAPKKTTHWEGVRNYQARNFMRDQFQLDDGVLFYHSNTEPPGIVGIAKVVRTGYPDAYALDPKNKYADPDAIKKGTNPWIMVDIQAVAKFSNPVTLEQLRGEKALAKMGVLQKGSRLSVQPVTEAEFETIKNLGKPTPV